MKKIGYLFGLLAVTAILAVSCQKNADKSMLEVRLTDSPGPYTAVNIDIRSVEVKGEGGKDIALEVEPQVVNLLELANGNDMLIATGALEPGEVSQIRLILGENNTIEKDGEIYPLSTPSAEQSGLKLQIHETFEAGVEYTILLDFDAYHSIHQTGNGTFKLKPVLRTIVEATGGSIKGEVSPAGTEATVIATSVVLNTEQPSLSYSSPADAEGKFILKGLSAGSYTLQVISNLPTSPKTVEGTFEVTVGQTTNVGTIEL